ncbi:MAG: TolB family protein, partial [Longimicrobiales bacterium]
MRIAIRATLPAITLALLCPAAVRGQATAGFKLTVQNIMRGPELVGEAPDDIRWTDDGRWILFRWKPGGRPWDEEPALYRVPATGGSPERLSDEAADSLAPLMASGPRSPDGRWRAVSSGGDLFLIDRADATLRRLTRTREVEGEPVFGNAGQTLFFVSENNVFALELDGNALRQITDIRTGPAPDEPEQVEGQHSFLESQQRELFEHIRLETEERERDRERGEDRRERDPLKTVYLDREERVSDVAIEPFGRYVLLTTTRPSDDGQRTIIPQWVTASGYTETREVRTKVGDTQQAPGRMGVLSLSDGDVHWLDLVAATGAGDEAGDSLLYGTRFLGWNRTGTHGLIAASSTDFDDAW